MQQDNKRAVDLKDGSGQVVDSTNVAEQMGSLIKDLEARHEKRIKDLENAKVALSKAKSLLGALPATLPQAPASVRTDYTVYRADAELTFEVTSRDQVLALIEALPGVPLLMVSGGTTAFIPEETYVSKTEQPGVKVSKIGEVVYRIEYYLYGPRETYFWWTRQGDLLVYVRAVTPEKGQSVSKVQGTVVEHLGQEAYRKRWVYVDLPEGTVTLWGGSNRQLMPVTVHQSRDVPFSEAVKTLQSYTSVQTMQRCTC